MKCIHRAGCAECTYTCSTGCITKATKNHLCLNLLFPRRYVPDDGLLTETEFYAAPWVLGGDLTVEDADEPPIDSAVASNVHAASSKAIDKVKPTGKLSGDVTENISHSRHPDD